MATNIKGQTIASTFQRVLLRNSSTPEISADTAAINVEVQEIDGDSLGTALNISTNRIGINASTPQEALHVQGNIYVSGNLEIDGTTTTIDSTTVTVADKNIVLGNVDTPSNSTATGGGITLEAGDDVDKTFTWISANSSWTSSEHMDLLNTKEYKINTSSVLSSTTLGAGVVNSSLTSVGAVTSGSLASGFGSIISTNITQTGTGALTLPAGTDAEQPSPVQGMIRYNTDDSQFEGYSGSAWEGLGGIIDADLDTHIVTTADNQLIFTTNDEEAIRIDSSQNVGIGTDSPSTLLNLEGASAETYIHATSGNAGITLDAHSASDSCFLNFKVAGNTNGFIQYDHDGTGSSDLMIFQVNDASAMWIKGDSNVGIGTNDPEKKLHIVHDSGTTEYPLMVENTNITAGARTGILFEVYDQEASIEVERDANNVGVDMRFLLADSSDGTKQERLTILESGNVGIGNAAPGNQFEMSMSAAGNALEISCYSTGIADQSTLKFKKSANATINTEGATADDEYLGQIIAVGVNNAGTPVEKTAASIKFNQDAAADSDSVLGRITFQTSDDDDSGNPTERMRIDSSGNVGIGATAPLADLDVAHATDPRIRLTRLDADVTTDDLLGSLQFASNDPSAGAVGASIQVKATSAWASNDYPCYMRFLITKDGESDQTEAMRITDDGKVGIGISPTDNLTIAGASTDPGSLEIMTNEGSTNAGKWRIRSHTDNALYISHKGSGSYDTILKLDEDSVISLSNNDGGYYRNTLFGKNAGANFAGTDAKSCAFGEDALTNMANATNEGENSAFGYGALTTLTTGYNNVGIGGGAGGSITTGFHNIAIGESAGGTGGFGVKAGYKNICIGHMAGVLLPEDSIGQIIIGENQQGNGNYSITLGSGSHTTYIPGALSVTGSITTVTNPTGDVTYADGGYTLGEQGRSNHVANTVPGNYYKFDGVDDYITLGTSSDTNMHPALGDYSIAFTAKFSSANLGEEEGVYYCSDDVPYDRHGLRLIQDNEIQWYIVNNSVAKSVIADFNLRDDKWHTVVLTWDRDGGATGTKIYVDGVECAYTERDDFDSISGSLIPDTAFNLGKEHPNSGSASNFCEMEISSFRIYNLLLSADEVKEIYSGSPTPYKYTLTSFIEPDHTQDEADFSKSNITLTHNTTVGGDAVFEYKLNGGSATHYMYLTTAQGPHQNGLLQRVTGEYYMPSGNTALDGFKCVYGSSGATLFDGSSATKDAWTTFSGEAITNTGNSNILIWATDGGSTTVNADNDVIGFRNLKFYTTGLIADYSHLGMSSGLLWYDNSGNTFHGDKDAEGSTASPVMINGSIATNNSTRAQLADMIHLGKELSSVSATGGGEGGYLYCGTDGSGNAKPYWISADCGATDLTTESSNTNGWTHNSGDLYPTTTTDDVAIGHSSPSFKLDVQGPSSSDDILALRHTAGGSQWIKMGFYNGSTERASIRTMDDYSHIGFFTGTDERLRIDAGGNVGIGTIAPDPSAGGWGNALTVAHTSTEPAIELWLNNASITDEARIGQVNFLAGTTAKINAAISAKQNSTAEAEAHLIFHTRDSGDSAGTPDERMRITSDGQVGIGTDNPTQALDVNGTIECTALTVGGVAVGTSTSSYWVDASGDISYSSGDITFGPTSSAAHLNISAGNVAGVIGYNAFNDGAWKYRKSGSHATLIDFNQGGNTGNMEFLVAPSNSGSDGASLTYTRAMKVMNDGNVAVGATTGNVGGSPGDDDGMFSVYMNESNSAGGKWISQMRADDQQGNGLFVRAGHSDSYYTAYMTGYDENDVNFVVRGDGATSINTTPTNGVALSVQVASENDWGLRILDSSGNPSIGLFVNGSGGGDIQAYKDDQATVGLRLTAEDTKDSYFNSGGNVGIGTDDPQDKLHVNGRIVITADGNTNVHQILDANPALQITPYNNEDVLIDTTGKVGIGDMGSFTPQYELDVDGTINATAFRIGGTTIDASDLSTYWSQNGNDIYYNYNVGIGVAAPAEKLQVAGAMVATAASATHHTSAVSLSQDSSTKSEIRCYGADGDTPGKLQISLLANDADPYKYYLFDSTGLGIGTTAPGTMLEIHDKTGGGLAKIKLNGKNVGGNEYDSTVALSLFPGNNEAKIYSHGTNGEYGADPYMRFALHNTAAGGSVYDVMTLLSGGNVGIGTTEPDQLLHVSESGDSDRPIIKITSESTQRGGTFAGDQEIQFEGTSDSGQFIGAAIRTYARGLASDEQMDISFYAKKGGAVMDEKMRIMGDTGNVGIGRDDPSSLLHITGEEDGELIALTLDNYAGGGGSDNESVSVLFQLSAGDKPNLTSAAKILVQKDTVQGTGDDADWNPDSEKDAFMSFNTKHNGTLDERMRITSSGNVGIGETNPTHPLQVKGSANNFVALFDNSNATNTSHGITIQCGDTDHSDDALTHYLQMLESDGNIVGELDNGAGSGALRIVTASDERLKENIKNSSVNGLNVINSLTLREFNWKKRYNKKVEKCGLIAQEVQKVLPSAVNVMSDEDKTLAIGQSDFVYTLIKAVQELSAKVEALENQQ